MPRRPQMKLEIHCFDGTMEEFMQTPEFKAFDEAQAEYTSDVLAMCLDGLTEGERLEFYAWWGSMQWEGFWETRSEAAQNAILTAISWGLG